MYSMYSLIYKLIAIIVTIIEIFNHYNYYYTNAQQFDEQIEQNLVINIKNNGQEVYQEVITANTTEDIIVVEFHESDGSLITQLIDFKSVFI